MNPAGTRRMRSTASPFQAKAESSGTFLASRATSASRRRERPLCRRRPPRSLGRLRSGWGRVVERVASASPAVAATPSASGTPVSSSITCRAKLERDASELAQPGASSRPRLGAAPLVGVLHRPERALGVLAPAQLATVVGGLLRRAALDRGDRSIISRSITSKSVPPQTAQRTASGSRRGDAARSCRSTPAGRSARSSATRLGELARLSRALFGMKRSIASSITALVIDAVPLLERQAQDRRCARCP